MLQAVKQVVLFFAYTLYRQHACVLIACCTFHRAVEERFPSSGEVGAASDLNRVPSINQVARFTKVQLADGLRFCTSANDDVF